MARLKISVSLEIFKILYFFKIWALRVDGRNRARVIAESLARVIAAIRITSVRLAVISPAKNTEFGPRRVVDPALVAIGLESRDWRSLEYSFHVGLRKGLRELTAFTEH